MSNCPMLDNSINNFFDMETFLSCLEECLFVVIVNFYRDLLRFLSKDLEALILIDVPDNRSEIN